MFLDEVDKIGSVPGIHQLRDVGGEGVQQVSVQSLCSSLFKGCNKLFLIILLFNLEIICSIYSSLLKF